MKVWGLLRNHHKIAKDVVQEFNTDGRPNSLESWTPVIGELCQALDLSRPVILQKHIDELARFSRTTFRPADFMEPVHFQRFEIEIFPEPKKNEM